MTREEDLELIFSRFGPVVECHIVKDHVTGDSLNYAFIDFKEQVLVFWELRALVLLVSHPVLSLCLNNCDLPLLLPSLRNDLTPPHTHNPVLRRGSL